MIGKFKLMIADVVVVSCSAVAASLVGNSAAAASFAQFLKLSEAASAFVGFFVMNIADCFFILDGFLSLESGFCELWWYNCPSFVRFLMRHPQPRHHGWTWRRARKQQLHPGTWWRRRRFPLAACLKSTPSFLTMLVKRGKKRRSEKVMRTLFCWCVGCRGENTIVVRCGSGWTALDLSASLRCRTSVPVHPVLLGGGGASG